MPQTKEFRPIPLTGLIGSNPLGALAAFGLLRVCSEIPELADVRLGWRMDDDWLAVLMVPDGTEGDQLIQLIVKWQQGWSADVIHWNDDIRSVPSDYRKQLVEYAQRASQGDRHLADFFSAFGSETVTDGSKGLVKPTMFHMTSGQQKFLKNVRDISDSMRQGADSSLREALFGPWRYADQYHSLGWDPAAERLYALRHRAPTSEPARCVRAAVWLGFQALPLFPTVRRNGRLATSGFTFSDGETSLIWPIWTSPVTLEGLRSLLTCSELTTGPSGWERLHRRGVVAVYRTVRSEFGQGYATLRPAQLMFSATH
jgi:hypothetical protein